MKLFVRYDAITGKINSTGQMDDTYLANEIASGAATLLVAALPDPHMNVVDVLTKAIVSAPGAAPTPPQLIAYAETKRDAALAAGISVPVATGVSVLCDGTSATRADLAMLALFGLQNPTGTKQWLDNNGVATMLTGAQFATLATLIGTWIENCYVAFAGIAGQAIAGTITTTAQIDALAWPTS
jgi:hypothetical protein